MKTTDYQLLKIGFIVNSYQEPDCWETGTGSLNKKNVPIMNKNKLIENVMNDIARKVEEHVEYEKKNLVRTKKQFGHDCNISNTTLDNIIKGRRYLNLSTAVLVLYECGYKITIEPL